jgi:glycerol-3-phosphate dehydrogenase (NAD(P)+)
MGLQIGVLGLGAWGSTLADLLADQGHRIQGWSRRQGGDPALVLAGADLVLSAVSMAGVRTLSRTLGPGWPEGLPLVSCSKGIDLEQGSTPSQLWQQQNPSLRVLVLSGPNLAQELAQGLPAASVLASTEDALARGLQQALKSDRLRLYTNSDPIGTEVAGALKNVMAIAAGVSDGLGLGANAKASLLCRALLEMGSVIQALGGEPASLYGLAGLGDLLATANSPLSRNYRFGLQLAQGCSADGALLQVGGTVEGVPTAQAVQRLADREGWHLPISHQVAALIAGKITPLEAVRQLMERELKAEGLPQLATGRSLP